VTLFARFSCRFLLTIGGAACQLLPFGSFLSIIASDQSLRHCLLLGAGEDPFCSFFSVGTSEELRDVSFCVLSVVALDYSLLFGLFVPLVDALGESLPCCLEEIMSFGSFPSARRDSCCLLGGLLRRVPLICIWVVTLGRRFF